MSKKAIANEIVEHLGFSHWKSKRGFGGDNFFFLNDNGRQIVFVVTQFLLGALRCSVSVGATFDELVPHRRLSNFVSDEPSEDVHKYLLTLNVDKDKGLDLAQIAQLKAAEPSAKEFLDRMNSIEAASAELDRLLEGETDLEVAVYNKAPSLIPFRFLVLAIKYEAKAADFETFRRQVKEINWVKLNYRAKHWNEIYEAGEMEQRLAEMASKSIDEPVTMPHLMQEHSLQAKPAVCGFVCEQKLTPEQLGTVLGITLKKVDDVELTDSVVDFRDGIDPCVLDLFDFGSGLMCITSNDSISDLDFEAASKVAKVLTFRAIEPSAMWSTELFNDGESVSMRVDHNGQTLRTGTDMLPDCPDGKMELYAILSLVQSEFGHDFWQLPQQYLGIRYATV